MERVNYSQKDTKDMIDKAAECKQRQNSFFPEELDIPSLQRKNAAYPERIIEEFTKQIDEIIVPDEDADSSGYQPDKIIRLPVDGI